MKKAVIIMALIAVSAALLNPATFAAADPLPTSSCVTDLTARFAAGDDGMGVISIKANVEGVEPEEYFNVSIYTSIEDISDPTEGSTKPPMSFRIYSAEKCVSDGKLEIDISCSMMKLKRKCAVCVQIPNRGDGNDWVSVYLKVPLAAYSGDGDELTVWAPAGFTASEWLEENGGDWFSRAGMKISGWKKSDGSELGDAVIPLKGISVTAQWTENNGYLLGDLDFDSEHSVIDALTALRMSVGLAEISEIDARVGDVDFDGEVTIVDALSILRVAAGLAEPYDIYV